MSRPWQLKHLPTMSASPTEIGAAALKAFPCHCGVSFSRMENLKRHQRQHEESKHVQCPRCFKNFSRTDVLKRHMKTHTSGEASGETASPGPRKRQRTLPSEPVEPETAHLQHDTMNVSQMREEVPLEFGEPLSVQSWQSESSFERAVLPSGYGIPPPSARENFFGGLPLDLVLDAIGHQDPMSFPTDGLTWDNGMQWLLQDSGQMLDFQWQAPASTESQAPPDPTEADHAYREVRMAGLPSRPASPPIDAAEEDKWPTSHRPMRPFVFGDGVALRETNDDPRKDPILGKWSRFWLDEAGFDRVKGSLMLAQHLPGTNSGTFKMPKHLNTVNSFIFLYFEHFYDQLPVLHLPTYQIATSPPLLIAGLISIGACLSRLRGSRAFAVDAVEVIRRTLVVLFEMDSMNLRSSDLIHVSVLACFAGLWSGHQRSFELAEMSRGMIINLCRRARLLESTTDLEAMHSAMARSGAQERWRIWTMSESKKRLGLAIFMLDSLFPALLDIPSYSSQGEMLATVLPCEDKFWLARSAQEWQGMLGVAPIPPSPYFSIAISSLLTPAYADHAHPPIDHISSFAALCLLNALHHHVYEFRSQLGVYHSIGLHIPLYKLDEPLEKGLGFEGRKDWLEGAFDLWKEHYYTTKQDPHSQSGRVLYHLGHLSLNVNARELNAAAGKHGPAQAETAWLRLKGWASSEESNKAASHALLLLGALDILGESDLLYAPTSAFVGILTLWVFTKLSAGGALAEQDVERVFGDGRPSAERILRIGAKYLASCRAWGIGAALSLVLIKLAEAE